MAHTVAVFLSFDGELDTQPLIEQLWRAGKRVYLPVLHPFSAGNLLFLNYHPQSELVMNRLKIHEPKLMCVTCSPFPIRRPDHPRRL